MTAPEARAQHTPGPFYVHLPRGVSGGCRTIRTEKGRTHGTYRGTEIATTHGLRNDAEDKANADLFAAAPAMAAERDRLREALKQAAMELEEAGKILCGNNLAGTGSIFTKAADVALAAARVEGS